MIRRLFYFPLVMILALTLLLLFTGQSDKKVEALIPLYADAQKGSKFLDLQDCRVHYRDQGEGDVVVLIHGTGSSLHTWEDFKTHFRMGYRLISMDIPAFGLTGPNTVRDYTIESYVNFLDSFLDALEIDSCSLIGNSLGGHIAWRYARSDPERLTSMVLIAPSGFSDGSDKPLVMKLAEMPILNQILKYVTPTSFIRKNLHEVYFDDAKVDDALVQLYHDMSLREGNRQAFIDRVRQVEYDEFDASMKINIPTLIIWGENDQWIDVSNVPKFESLLPLSKTIIMKETGHVPMEERPESTANMVLGFFEDLKSYELIIQF